MPMSKISSLYNPTRSLYTVLLKLHIFKNKLSNSLSCLKQQWLHGSDGLYIEILLCDKDSFMSYVFILHVYNHMFMFLQINEDPVLDNTTFWPFKWSYSTYMCVYIHSLYKVDLSALGVGHLPVVRQRSQRVLWGRMAQVRVCLLCALRGDRWWGGRPSVGRVTLVGGEGSHRVMNLV